MIIMFVDKKEIVSKFLNEGYQLDTKALEFFTKKPGKIGDFLKNFKKTVEERDRPTTITLKHVLSIFGASVAVEVPELEIIKKFPTKRKEKVDIEQYISMYNKRYEKISKILLGKMSNLKVTSINNIQKQTEFSLIAMVREKDPIERTLLVEDPTGNIIVYIEDKEAAGVNEYEAIIEDDIFGLVCGRTPSGIKVKQIIWPGIPLNRKINKTDESIKCLFISNLHIDSPKHNNPNYKKLINWVEKTKFEKFYIFVLGGLSANKKDVKKFLSHLPKNSFKIFLRSNDDAKFENASKIDKKTAVSKDPILISIKGVKIFLVQGERLQNYKRTWPNTNAGSIIINLLKRRAVRINGNVIILEEVPDVFAMGGFGRPETSNYKGTTIISTGDFIDTSAAWVLDLKTREINKLNFS